MYHPSPVLIVLTYVTNTMHGGAGHTIIDVGVVKAGDKLKCSCLRIYTPTMTSS